VWQVNSLGAGLAPDRYRGTVVLLESFEKRSGRCPNSTFIKGLKVAELLVEVRIQMDKTILITGSSSGIGKVTAKLFHEKGWNVIATMRRPENESELNKLDRVLVTRLDVIASESIQAAVKQGMDRFGNIDVLLNNAGFGVFGPLEATPLEKIREQFETNILGLLASTKVLLPIFRKNHAGMIINVSSVAGKIAFPLSSIYNGTKFALEGISEALSFEMAEIGVKVKIVEPGAIRTSFKFDLMNDESIPEYQELFQTLQEFSKNVAENGADPMEVAEVIYRAATDGTDQLRYVSGRDAEELLARRRVEDESAFLKSVRNFMPTAA
jgi:NAD(P)-dependent dehydrogenase (short-subunit alcohol dehydrogenase family)